MRDLTEIVPRSYMRSLHQVNEILKSLCDADMLHTDPGHDLTYHFKHASLREVSSSSYYY